jgi:hypothetical protein
MRDERQKKILTEAALVGEAMAKANDLEKRGMETAHYADGMRMRSALPGYSALGGMSERKRANPPPHSAALFPCDLPAPPNNSRAIEESIDTAN